MNYDVLWIAACSISASLGQFYSVDLNLVGDRVGESMGRDVRSVVSTPGIEETMTVFMAQTHPQPAPVVLNPDVFFEFGY